RHGVDGNSDRGSGKGEDEDRDADDENQPDPSILVGDSTKHSSTVHGLPLVTKACGERDSAFLRTAVDDRVVLHGEADLVDAFVVPGTRVGVVIAEGDVDDEGRRLLLL